jgi:hypothetical protein
MDPASYIAMLVESFNPNRYGKLVEQPLRKHLSFLLYSAGLSLAVFTLILVPVTLFYIAALPSHLEPVHQLQVDATVNASAPVMLIAHPPITLDMEANGTRGGLVTLSNDGILYPKYLLFGTDLIQWSAIKDLKQQSAGRDKLLAGIIVFLLPSIIFWFFLLNMLGFALLGACMLLLGWGVPKAFGHRLTPGEALRLVIITCPSMMLFSFGLYALGVSTLFWVGICMSVALFSIGVILVCELPDQKKFSTIK